MRVVLSGGRQLLQMLKRRRCFSWEVGTLAEALLELEWPSLSIYGAGSASVHPPLIGAGNTTASDVFALAAKTLTNKPADSLALVANDGAVGDPASPYLLRPIHLLPRADELR